jgi:predicted NACHT family NTPase
MKLVGAVIILLTLTSASLAKKAERHEKKSDPVRTINTLRAKGKSISFTCSPTNCREQQDGSLLFNLSCQTSKEGDKLEISVGDKSQTVQAYGFVDIPGDIKAPKKGSVPMKISVSEDEGSPKTTFTFKYTVEQIRRPTCLKYGDVEL